MLEIIFELSFADIAKSISFSRFRKDYFFVFLCSLTHLSIVFCQFLALVLL